MGRGNGDPRAAIPSRMREPSSSVPRSAYIISRVEVVDAGRAIVRIDSVLRPAGWLEDLGVSFDPYEGTLGSAAGAPTMPTLRRSLSGVRLTSELGRLLGLSVGRRR